VKEFCEQGDFVMSERLEKSHLVICVLALMVIFGGFIIRTFLMGNPVGRWDMAVWGILAIVVFFCLGFIARAFLCDVFVKPEIEENKELAVADGIDLNSAVPQAYEAEDEYAESGFDFDEGTNDELLLDATHEQP